MPFCITLIKCSFMTQFFCSIDITWKNLNQHQYCVLVDSFPAYTRVHHVAMYQMLQRNLGLQYQSAYLYHYSERVHLIQPNAVIRTSIPYPPPPPPPNSRGQPQMQQHSSKYFIHRPPHHFPRPWRVGSKVPTFSEQGHVAYQINGDGA